MVRGNTQAYAKCEHKKLARTCRECYEEKKQKTEKVVGKKDVLLEPARTEDPQPEKASTEETHDEMVKRINIEMDREEKDPSCELLYLGSDIEEEPEAQKVDGGKRRRVGATATPEKEQKKQARKRWKWFKGVDMQQVSHIGDETTSAIWENLKNLSKEEFLASSTHQDEMLQLQLQMISFTGPSKRKHTTH